jgi:Asp-tRNA(Asn)/Glu-tRNA(Gln) amidotransferase A subunit family amidase
MKHFDITHPFIGSTEHQMAIGNGLLNGQRLAVKDLFHCAGIATSAGNPTWLATHDIPQETAPAVSLLTRAGARFVGKTITDELAYSLDGNNIHYGSPINRQFPEQLSGGSSSGSAIAVANGDADIGLGSDTGGSIRVPASYNGLFGLRPTWGRVNVDGMLPLAPSFDTVGWMTKELDLSNQVAQVLMVKPDLPEISLNEFVSVASLQGDSKHREAMTKLSQIRSFSNTTFPNEVMDILAEAGEMFSVLQGYEIWQNLGDWVSKYNLKIDPSIHQRLAICQSVTPELMMQAKTKQQKLASLMTEFLSHQRVLVVPTTPSAAPLRSDSSASLVHYRKSLLGLTAIAGLCGLPQLHIPCCQITGRPSGISFIGPKNSDLSLLALAKESLSVLI